MAGRRVLVTGAAGFLGAALVRRLEARGDDVFTLGRHGTRLIADLSDGAAVAAAFEAARPEVAFHLAASTAGRDGAAGMEEALAVNVGGTLQVMRAAAAVDCATLVQTGTAQVYGLGAAVPCREDAQVRPASAYAWSKAACETMAALFPALGTVSLRLPVVYGPGQRPTMLIPDLIDKATRGAPFVMTRGEQQRDFVYVEDVVDAIMLAGERAEARGQVINVGTGRPTAVREVVAAVLARLGDPIAPRMELPYRAGEDMCTYLDVEKAARLLGWRAPTSLEDGISRTIAARR